MLDSLLVGSERLSSVDLRGDDCLSSTLSMRDPDAAWEPETQSTAVQLPLRAQELFISSWGSTEAVWAEGSVFCCCLWVLQTRMEVETKAAPPLLLHDARSGGYRRSCWHYLWRVQSDGEVRGRGNHWKRSVFLKFHGRFSLSLPCSHPVCWQKAPLPGCPACAEAAWLWRRSVQAGQTESVEMGKPSLTWFPHQLQGSVS